MSVSSLGTSSSASAQELYKQRRDALKAMEQSVQSGNISDAQQSLAALQQAQSAQGANTGAGAQSGDNPYKSLMTADLSNVMSAVSSGNVTSAQSALTTWQSDRKTGAASASAATASAAPTDPAQDPFLASLGDLLSASEAGDASGVQAAAGSLQAMIQGASTPAAPAAGQPSSAPGSQGQDGFLSNLQTLVSAVQSGDVPAAQDAAAQLAQEIKSAAGGAGKAGGHHHHHGGAGATSASTDPTATTAATDPDATDPTDTTTTDGSVPTIPGTDIPLTPESDPGNIGRDAKAAYDMLMKFAQAGTPGAADRNA